jgi:cytochrome c oxidase subunit 2
VEIIWTVVPLLILLAIAWPATRAVLNQKSTHGEDMTIRITGYQWKWRYDYLDDNFGFVSHLATRVPPCRHRRPSGALPAGSG